MRRITITLAILVLPPVSQVHVRTQGPGQNFVLVEEARLPRDIPEPPGTSTLDIDLVDVDGDGDLDIYKAQGTDSLEGRPNQLLINTGSGNFVDESAARLLGISRRTLVNRLNEYNLPRPRKRVV